jgi:hemoglobin/transferrin/lactoferrin receptor protein
VGPENCPAEHVSRDGGKVNPKFTLAANPTNWLQLYTTYSHTYRPPTAQESFWGLVGIGAQLGSGIYNNMDLKPETSKGWDLGFNIAKNDLFFEKDAARLKVGYFDNRIKNYITNGTISMERCAGAAECWYDTAMWINVPGTTRMRGVEIEGGYDAGFAYANFSYTNARTRTPAGGMVGGGGNADIDILPEDYGMIDVGLRFFEEKLALAHPVRHLRLIRLQRSEPGVLLGRERGQQSLRRSAERRWRAACRQGAHLHRRLQHQDRRSRNVLEACRPRCRPDGGDCGPEGWGACTGGL